MHIPLHSFSVKGGTNFDFSLTIFFTWAGNQIAFYLFALLFAF